MSYNDGWRVYEDNPEHVEKRNILITAKKVIEKQLEKQQQKVNTVSESTRKLEVGKDSPKRRSAANMKLSEECSHRDALQRRLWIIEEWLLRVSLEAERS